MKLPSVNGVSGLMKDDHEERRGFSSIQTTGGMVEDLKIPPPKGVRRERE